jgi:two-component system chemotaxis response regulator CheB
MPEKVRALIVDDSAYMRVVLKDMLESDQGISVIGTAKDGLEAIDKVKELKPDVVLLDIQMPRMDGVATLQRIMKEAPTRVIMLSAMDKVDTQLPLKALEMGAVDFISKPSGPVSIDIVNFADAIIQVVKGVADAKVEVLKKAHAPLPDKLKYLRKDAFMGTKVIVLAASTGGPRALEVVFAALPRDLPAFIFIVQHIPQDFSASFAKRLDAARGPKVVMASDGLIAEKGVAYLAPGGRHTRIGWKGATTLIMKLEDGAPVNFVKPSADILFKSAADCMGASVLGIILTGMGSDGAEGAKAIRAGGGRILVQSEQSSVAASMPKAVIQAGAADKIVSLEEISREIIRFLEG